MNKFFSVIDLFSGCGGSALGFKQAGFKIKVAVDINPTSTKTFSLNFPETSIITSDISYVTGKDLLDAAKIGDSNRLIIIACPPCQGFSSARRKSQQLSDKRNTIIYEFVRLLEEIRPFGFVMENVSGLAKGVGTPIFLNVLQKLKALGYFTVHGIVDTADYGIPQRRKRLVLIGSNDSNIRLSFPKPSHQNPDMQDRYLPPWNTVRSVIGDLGPIMAGKKTINNYLHKSPSLSAINIKRLMNTPRDGGDRSSWPEDLILECHKKVTGYKDIYGRMRWDNPSPTITAGCVMISKGRFGHPEQNRAISLKEAARLQTFPDNYLFSGNVTDIASQIGNAVPPLLAKKIGDSLYESIKDSVIFHHLIKRKENINDSIGQNFLQ